MGQRFVSHDVVAVAGCMVPPGEKAYYEIEVIYDKGLVFAGLTFHPMLECIDITHLCQHASVAPFFALCPTARLTSHPYASMHRRYALVPACIIRTFLCPSPAASDLPGIADDESAR